MNVFKNTKPGLSKYVIVLFGLIVIMAGCKKDLTSNYAFNLDGVSERGNNYTATYRLDTISATKQFVANFYIGSVADTNYVQVSFSGNSYITPGNYYTGITNPGYTICSFAYNNKHTYYANISGILQIVQIDTVLHTLKGNFQFTAVNTTHSTDTIAVTDGGFAAIKYSVQ